MVLHLLVEFIQMILPEIDGFQILIDYKVHQGYHLQSLFKS
jgi:hypothetical protein